MSKPSLNHVSAIQCSQIRKHCRNASIFSVSSLTKGPQILFGATLKNSNKFSRPKYFMSI